MCVGGRGSVLVILLITPTDLGFVRDPVVIEHEGMASVSIDDPWLFDTAGRDQTTGDGDGFIREIVPVDLSVRLENFLPVTIGDIGACDDLPNVADTHLSAGDILDAEGEGRSDQTRPGR